MDKELMKRRNEKSRSMYNLDYDGLCSKRKKVIDDYVRDEARKEKRNADDQG